MFCDFLLGFEDDLFCNSETLVRRSSMTEDDVFRALDVFIDYDFDTFPDILAGALTALRRSSLAGRLR